MDQRSNTSERWYCSYRHYVSAVEMCDYVSPAAGRKRGSGSRVAPFCHTRGRHASQTVGDGDTDWFVANLVGGAALDQVFGGGAGEDVDEL